MKGFLIKAMKNLGVFEDSGTYHSFETLRDAMNSMKTSEIKSKTNDILILLMNLPASLLEQSSDEVIMKSLKTIEHDERNQSLVLKIESNTICLKSYMQLILLEIFGGYGRYEESDNLHYLHIDRLCTPANKHSTSFEGCKFSMRWLGNSKYELILTGTNCVILLVYFFDKMIESLLNESDSDTRPKIKDMHDNIEQNVNLTTEDTIKKNSGQV